MSAILEIKNLRGGYLSGIDILQGVNLSVEKGEAIGIIGLNGSGKSTLGKAIMNMIPIRQGEIIYNGESIINLSTTKLSQKGIVIMQQGGQVFQTMSVWDNLQLAFGKYQNSSYFYTLLDIIPLLKRPKQELQHLMADRLSGGERHQLALAMTLARKPQLAILDEPSAGLSPKAVEEMYEILSLIREKLGITILLIEQNIHKVIMFCNYCVLIAQGKIISEIKTQDISEVERIMFNKK